jgi:hypothetical protein
MGREVRMVEGKVYLVKYQLRSYSMVVEEMDLATFSGDKWTFLNREQGFDLDSDYVTVTKYTEIGDWKDV